MMAACSQFPLPEPKTHVHRPNAITGTPLCAARGRTMTTRRAFQMLENESLWEVTERIHGLLTREGIDHAIVGGVLTRHRLDHDA